MTNLLQDIRYAIRVLAKNPGFTLVAVLTLALGIGANTAILSIVDAMLFRSVPYDQPRSITYIFQSELHSSRSRFRVPPANFSDWKQKNLTYAEMAAFRQESMNLTSVDTAVRVRAIRATDALFRVFGIPPHRGRVFTGADAVTGRETVAVLSYGLWQRSFGGRNDVLGSTIKLNDQIYSIVGVMPPGFRFPLNWGPGDLWIPLLLDPREWSDRQTQLLQVVARLKPDSTPEQAQADLDVLMTQLATAYPETNRNWGATVFPIAEESVSDFRGMVWTLTLAVNFVLLVACLNLANLFLVRGVVRQHELRVRAAMGASRWRLIQQMVTEGVLLASLGGVVGALAAAWGLEGLKLLMAGEFPEVENASINLTVLATCAAVSLACGLFFSIVPALNVTRDVAVLRLTATRLSTVGPGGRWLRHSLIAGQVAITTVLLLGAGAVLHNFWEFLRVHPGYEAANAFSFRMTLSERKHAQAEQKVEFVRQVEERIAALPGVSSVATGSAPMQHTGEPVNCRMFGAPETRELCRAEYFRVSPDYFTTLRIALRQGRIFDERDRAGARPVAIADETFARLFFAGKSALGKQVLVELASGPVLESGGGLPIEIVGVVGEVREWGLHQRAVPTLYVPFRQNPHTAVTIVVQTFRDPTAVMSRVPEALREVDAEQPLFSLGTLAEWARKAHAEVNSITMALTCFAAMALSLAMVGLYGVVSFTVAQRTREIGIRMALGAQGGRILRLTIGESMATSAVGLALGLAAGYPLIPWMMERMRFVFLRTDVNQLSMFAICALALCGAVLLASWIPARKAMRVDPLVALRYE